MQHTRLDAPEGFMYRRKGTESDFASTAFLGNGVSIYDYELITIEEYNRIMEEQEKASSIDQMI